MVKRAHGCLDSMLVVRLLPNNSWDLLQITGASNQYAARKNPDYLCMMLPYQLISRIPLDAGGFQRFVQTRSSANRIHEVTQGIKDFLRASGRPEPRFARRPTGNHATLKYPSDKPSKVTIVTNRSANLESNYGNKPLNLISVPASKVGIDDNDEAGKWIANRLKGLNL